MDVNGFFEVFCEKPPPPLNVPFCRFLRLPQPQIEVNHSELVNSHLLKLLAAALALGLVHPSAVKTDPDQPWTAQWIGPAQTHSNTWLCFRKTVDLSHPSSSVKARIAVDSKYWLWINGKAAIFEGGLKRGPTPQDTYYDEVEIGPLLKPGKN